MSCGTACPETCDTLLAQDKNRLCTMNCVPGCFCKYGYVRDTYDNKCVQSFKCREPRDQDHKTEYSDTHSAAFHAKVPLNWIFLLLVVLVVTSRIVLN